MKQFKQPTMNLTKIIEAQCHCEGLCQFLVDNQLKICARHGRSWLCTDNSHVIWEVIPGEIQPSGVRHYNAQKILVDHIHRV